MKACPHCREQNRDEAKFCGHCAKPLSSDTLEAETKRAEGRQARRNFPGTKALKPFALGIVVGYLPAVALSEWTPEETAEPTHVALRPSNPARRQLEKMGIPYSQNQFMAEVGVGNTEVVELFLRAGVGPEGGLISLARPLGVAIKKGHTKTVEILPAHGADPNRGGLIAQQTPLMTAVERSQYAIVKLLLDNGAFVNARDDKGKTALALARSKNRAAIVQLLKEAGAKED